MELHRIIGPLERVGVLEPLVDEGAKGLPVFDDRRRAAIEGEEVLDEIAHRAVNVGGLGVTAASHGLPGRQRELPGQGRRQLVLVEDVIGGEEGRDGRVVGRIEPRSKVTTLARRTGVDAEQGIGSTYIGVLVELRLAIAAGIVSVGRVKGQLAVAVRVERSR